MKFNGEYKYKAQHIRLMEEHLGRSMAPGEHVHHVNGDKRDNSIENLMALTSTQHRMLHGFLALTCQREHDAIGDIRQVTEAFLASL